jgi:putative FmdB family regulatory protein
MPTYEYRCTECDHDFEVFQKFSEAPLTQCPVCRGRLRKVFSPVGIVFKGSGFYSTDSHRSRSTTSSTAPTSHDAAHTAGKPAAVTPATTTSPAAEPTAAEPTAAA